MQISFQKSKEKERDLNSNYRDTAGAINLKYVLVIERNIKRIEIFKTNKVNKVIKMIEVQVRGIRSIKIKTDMAVISQM